LFEAVETFPAGKEEKQSKENSFRRKNIIMKENLET